MDKVFVDIQGLDLVMGGGIPAVRRGESPHASATLLVRGPAGSGKSIFGTQIAGAIARRLGCDVAYGCVELVPQELEAQHAAFGRADERVFAPPFARQDPPAQGRARIFAAVLDIGEAGKEQDNLGGAVIELLDVVTACVGKAPRVLVIDSLSDGYDLGASAPRELADRLCKLATERGMFLILLEETVDRVPSSWSFATDIVFELGPPMEAQAATTMATLDRRITVAKNRFAPSDAGPHSFTIDVRRGVTLFPRPSCYLASWAKDVILPELEPSPADTQAWGVPLDAEWPEFRSCVTAVYGSDAAAVFDVAMTLGASYREDGRVAARDIFIDFGRVGRAAPDRGHGHAFTVRAGHPFLSGERLITYAVQAIRTLTEREVPVRRVLIGDFQSIRKFLDPDGLRRAVGVLIGILRRVGIPAVLFETRAGRGAHASSAHAFYRGSVEHFTDSEEPAIADVADVGVEIAPIGETQHAIMTDVRGRRRAHWELGPIK